MIIDGHAHACGSYSDSDKIIKYLRKHRIDKVILCGGEPGSLKDYGYPMMSKVFRGEGLGYFFNKIIKRVTKAHHLSEQIDKQNEYVYEIAVKLPQKVFNAYWVNPSEADCFDKMKTFYSEKGFKLIKMHQCWTEFTLKCASCDLIFKWAADHHIPVFIHIASKDEVNIFAEIANANPKTRFIVAHLIGADSLLGKLHNHNVYWDLSAPQLYSERMLKKVIDTYGVDKLLLGSDTPYGKNNIELVLKRLKKCNLSPKAIEKITSGNIISLLNKKI